MLAAAPEAPWDPSPSPTTNRGAAWRGIWASAVREARFIAEASIGGRLHLRPGPAPLQLEPGGIPQPRGQCLRNHGPGAGAGGRRAGRPGQGAGTRSQLSRAADPRPECRPGWCAGAGTQASAVEVLQPVRALARPWCWQPGPGPHPSRRSPERSSSAAAEPRRSSGSLPARRRRQRRPRRCCSCGAAAQVPREPGSVAAASLALAPARGGRGLARRQLWVSAAFLVRPRAPLASQSPPARSSPARAHTRASHTAAPRTAPPRTRRSAAPAAARGRRAPPGPRPPRPIASLPGAAVLGSAAWGPAGRCGGQGRRAGERRALETG